VPADDEDEADGAGFAFGGLEFDVRREETASPARRRRVRALVATCVTGALVAIAAAVAGVIVVNHYLDQRSTVGAAISATYQRSYRSCVENGGGRAACGAAAAADCRVDPRWRTEPDRVTEIAAHCRFGPDSSR
jgi:hypothetical protein